MDIWLLSLCGILILVILLLLIKIFLLQKAAVEIEAKFADRLTADTNTLIDITSRDRQMRRLAAGINTELQKLREERHHFQQGDYELKEAVTNISHDLRTPLTAICGYLDLLEKEDKSEAAVRYLEVIRDRAEVLKQLTEELFRYSVIASSKDEENSENLILNNILEDSISAYYAALKGSRITPEISIPEEKVCRRLNRNSLSRVFGNVISNAIKYSDGDLQITLSDKGEIVFANRAQQLNEILVGRLFDRFYTVEAGRSSTGLGLSIAKILTEQMGGEISARYCDGTLSIHIFFPETLGLQPQK